MPQKKFYIQIILVFFLFPYSLAFADSSLPYSYEKMELLEDGKLFVDHGGAPDQILSYFFKPNFYDDSEVLYTWKGITRKNAKGTIFRHGYILSGKPIENKLFAIWRSPEAIFCGILDSSASIIKKQELPGEVPDRNIDVRIDFHKEKNTFVVLIDKTLISCKIEKDEIKVKEIAMNVYSFDINNGEQYDLAYIMIREGSGLIYSANLSGEQHFASRIPVFANVMLITENNMIFAITYPNNSRNTILRIVDSRKGTLSEFNLEETGRFIEINSANNKNIVFYLSKERGKNALFKSEMIDFREMKNIYVSYIPEYFIEPMAMKLTQNEIYILFRNGLVSYDLNGTLQSADVHTFGEYFNDEPKMIAIDGKLAIRGLDIALILNRKYNSLWMINSFLETTGKAIIPILSIVIIFIFVQLYRHQKRLLSAVLNLPSSGIVFVIDKNGRLTKANSSGKNVLGITNSVPLGKPFQYYCVLEHTKPINELVQKSLSLRETITQKLSISDNDKNSKEWYCTALPLRNVAGQFRGIVFTGVDITEELERRRLSNWAQLAHDIQTNLSTIKLNAEQMQLEESSKDLERRNKILHQTKLMIKRIRDIVTVGRADSLGMQQVLSADICAEVRNEFDETLFPDIEFSLDCKSFKVYCDKPKLIRALRNAVENAIKAIPDGKGVITIACWNDARSAFFSVKDTGPGMNEKTAEKMMTPYFTTAEKKGGYGMGTMIMQHVMDLHGGKLLIRSKKGEGTEVLFTFPNFIKKQRSK